MSARARPPAVGRPLPDDDGESTPLVRRRRARPPALPARRRRRARARAARRSSTPRAGTGSPSTRRAAATGRARSARCASLEGDVPVGSVDPRAFSARRAARRAGGWPAGAQAREDLVVEVPPLQTRPKAALVGVGRHVILRPSVQKRYVELDEPTLEDQRSDVQRLLDAIDDLEPRVDLEVARTLGRVLRDAHFKVTAVVCDEALVAVEPGDTTGRRYALAFDLGTTTVVATLLDLETGTPAAVRSMLNRQQPYGADVISRVSATMLDDRGARRAAGARARRRSTTLAARGLRARPAWPPDEVYEITLCGNVTMTQLALGIDPEPLSMAPFIVTAHELPPARATDFGVARAPARARLRVPVARRLRRRRHRRRPARHRASPATAACGCSSTWARTARSRSARPSAWWPPRRRPGPAFEAAQIRCGMRAADGAIEGVQIDGDELRPAGHRRRRAGGHVRLGPRRRRGRARARRAARPLRALRARRGGAPSAPAASASG